MIARDGDARPRGRLHVVHTTRFAYEPSVGASFNECRITPVSDERQQVLRTSLAADPSTWRHVYRDYWGTEVVAFEVTSEHDVLTVTGTSLVDAGRQGPVPQASWGALGLADVRDLMVEELSGTERSTPGEELEALARDVVGDLAPAEAAEAVCRLVTEHLEYAPGSTGVQTVAEQAWEARRGVCQDFAHLACGALRSVGVPARYVSGYLHPRSDAERGETVAGESHAWVEWWTGGWFAWDPTNDVPVGPDHVTVGRGRDYADVPPVKGVVAGLGSSTLDVEVAVTRLS